MLATMTTLSKTQFFKAFFPKMKKKKNRIAKQFCGIDLKLSKKLLDYDIDMHVV